jgi:hypothetical protein
MLSMWFGGLNAAYLALPEDEVSGWVLLIADDVSGMSG